MLKFFRTTAESLRVRITPVIDGGYVASTPNAELQRVFDQLSIYHQQLRRFKKLCEKNPSWNVNLSQRLANFMAEAKRSDPYMKLQFDALENPRWTSTNSRNLWKSATEQSSRIIIQQILTHKREYCPCSNFAQIDPTIRKMKDPAYVSYSQKLHHIQNQINSLCSKTCRRGRVLENEEE